MTRLLIKISVFLLMTMSFIFIVKISSRILSDPGKVETSFEPPRPSDTTLFFIGSSRVQRSVDPALIKHRFSRFGVQNVAIAGGTFFSSCMIADFLMQQDGHKVLFIELSPLVEGASTSLRGFSDEADISPIRSAFNLSAGQPFQERSMLVLSVINQSIHSSVALLDEVKVIIGYGNSFPLIGFYTSDKNYLRSTSSFIKYEEACDPLESNIDLTRYLELMNHLKDKARKTNSQIIFFYPINYTKQAEKRIVISLYHTLPDSMRLGFSEGKIAEITSHVYLLDALHMNRKGATVYSKMLTSAIENHFKERGY